VPVRSSLQVAAPTERHSVWRLLPNRRPTDAIMLFTVLFRARCWITGFLERPRRTEWRSVWRLFPNRRPQQMAFCSAVAQQRFCSAFCWAAACSDDRAGKNVTLLRGRLLLEGRDLCGNGDQLAQKLRSRHKYRPTPSRWRRLQSKLNDSHWLMSNRPPRPPSCAPSATLVSFCLWFSSGRSLRQPRAFHLLHHCKHYRLLQALTVVGIQSVVEKGL